MLRTLRRPARFVVQRRFGVTLHGVEHVPATGPVILASNHVGVADGPLLADLQPASRPRAHQAGDVRGRAGPVPPQVRAGPARPVQLRPARPSRPACASSATGEWSGSSPRGPAASGEFHRFHRGAAYLGLVSGAPIVPVIQFGTREPGDGSSALPKKGGHVELVYGAPHAFDAVPWPRTKQARRGRLAVAARVHDRPPRARQAADRPDAARPDPRVQGQGSRPRHEHPEVTDDRGHEHSRGDAPVGARAGRRRPPQRRQVDPGQPHHRPPRGGRRGRARA